MQVNLNFKGEGKVVPIFHLIFAIFGMNFSVISLNDLFRISIGMTYSVLALV